MDIRQLRYFLAIAEEGQISGAAKRLHIAQPPLSQQLKNLEAELGVQLVERGSRQAKLTEAGRALRDRAEQILDLVDATTKEVKEFHEGAKGTLSLGTVASLGATLLPERIRRFNSQHPGIDFLLWEEETLSIIELLNNGVVEIGMVRLPVDTNTFDFIELAPESFVAAMSPKWRPAEKETLSFADLAGKPLLIHRRHEKMITDNCRLAGIEPQILCRANDIRSMLAWADVGIGVAIATSSAVHLTPGIHLRYLQLDAPGLEVTAAIIWLKNRRLSTAARRFLETFTTIE